jgi:hypothetical protein
VALFGEPVGDEVAFLLDPAFFLLTLITLVGASVAGETEGDGVLSGTVIFELALFGRSKRA